jgi:probable phosphoglycerate mutase
VEETRIILVRHGESLAQERRIVGGHAGCEGLSEKGRRQVEALRDRLAATSELGTPDALYASILPRAIETAEILAEALDVPDVVSHCDFCEHHPGDGDGLAWDEFERLYPAPTEWDPDHRVAPGAESWAEMAERVARALDRAVEDHPGGTIVVACHGGVVIHSMLRWLDLAPSPGRPRAWMNPTNSSITEWRVGGTSPMPHLAPVGLIRFNDHAHLAGTDLVE